MEVTVSVNFTQNPEALGELWRAFSIYEFKPENRIECRDGLVTLTVFFEEKPPIQMMQAISKGVIVNALYGEASEEQEKGEEITGELLVQENAEKAPQEEEKKTEEPSFGVSAQNVLAQEPPVGEQVQLNKKANQQYDLSGISDELKAIQNFEEIGKILNLNEDRSTLLCQVIEVACGISGRITWEKITECLSENGVKLGNYDKKIFTTAVEKKFGISTIKMLKMIAQIVHESKTSNEDENVPENPDAEVQKNRVINAGGEEIQKLPLLNCIRAKVENVPEALVKLEEELRKLPQNDSLELKDRIAHALTYFGFGTENRGENLIDMIEYLMRLPVISFEDSRVEREFGNVMLNRVLIANTIKDKMDSFGVENVIVSSEDFLADLRDMIMTDEELQNLVE